ncbi:hypothetical protein ON010_g9056 [Phytophthora cinnamomi]|nr:hypothetical protein ON010_g9056 [Phytophthora cinnamomi]
MVIQCETTSGYIAMLRADSLKLRVRSDRLAVNFDVALRQARGLVKLFEAGPAEKVSADVILLCASRGRLERVHLVGAENLADAELRCVAVREDSGAADHHESCQQKPERGASKGHVAQEIVTTLLDAN